MNFQNMEYFMMAAETGNITRAAERLGRKKNLNS